eukprot:gene1165-1272_t
MNENPQEGWADHLLDWSVQDDLFDTLPSVSPTNHLLPPVPQALLLSQQKVGSRGDLSVDGSGRKKISDATVYGPRFCQIFRAYQTHYLNNANGNKYPSQQQQQPIDLSRHLMALCSDHLVDFVKWARSVALDDHVSPNSAIHATSPNGEPLVVDRGRWISELLLANDYLRPEVRNGIIMILIYTFASMKATLYEGFDMFITLQDNEQGLGIANRFSLKIYNDPFNYLLFLKTSLSALIDAGVIPDNERLNQPKKSNKMQFCNKEEWQAYSTIRETLLRLLDSGDNQSARNYVAHITHYWQVKGKYVRNRRFASALEMMRGISLSQPPPGMVIVPPATASSSISNTVSASSSSNATIGTVAYQGITGLMSEKSAGEMMSGSEASIDGDASVISRPSSESKAPLVDVSAKESRAVVTAVGAGGGRDVNGSTRKRQLEEMQMSGLVKKMPSNRPPPLAALRFEKVGPQDWQLQETRWFNLQAFIDTALNPPSTALGSVPELCLSLVDETSLADEMKQMHMISKPGQASRVSLIRELQVRQALLTTWPRRELSQFLSFVQLWQEQAEESEPSISLLTMWKRLHGSSSSTAVEDDRRCSVGYIVYETVHLIGFIIRGNAKIGLSEDIWCSVFPNEIGAEDGQQTMADYLTQLFPQLLAIVPNVQKDRTTVRYFAHKPHCGPSEPFAQNGKEEFAQSKPSQPSTSEDVLLPNRPLLQYFQTIGTLSTPAVKVLSRLSGEPLFHDFLLEAI